MPGSSRRLRKALLLGAFLALCAMIGVPSRAQTAPTADQLKMLQSLPQAQRDALLQQMGIAPGGNATGAAVSGSDQITVRSPAASAEAEAAARNASERDVRIRVANNCSSNSSCPSSRRRRTRPDCRSCASGSSVAIPTS